MKRLIVMILSFFMLASMWGLAGEAIAVESNKNSKIITRADSQSWVKAPAENFTGNVRVKTLFIPNDSVDFFGAYVNFEPGARSVWHIHSTGQYLLVTDGVGWTQQWGGPIEEIRSGDVIWCPAGVKHWHGASSSSTMTHIALVKVGDGQNVEWLEKVSDKQYNISNLSISQVQTTNNQVLNAKQQGIITIAAFTANGNLEKLKSALNEGLNAGLTVNEIKEILVQMYAYAGFPRSLNGISTFRTVLEEREGKGIKDEVGKEASPLPSNKSSIELGREVLTNLIGRPNTAMVNFVPIMDEFLKGHLFGDIFGRDILDYQSRELATISALASIESVSPQLQGHFHVAFNIGVTEVQIRSLISVIEAKVGQEEADNAKKVLNRVLSSRDLNSMEE